MMLTALRAVAVRLFRPQHIRFAPFQRALATTPSPPSSMDEVNDLFAEANMSLQDALESRGTVYFEDDFQDAKETTNQTLAAFDALIEASSPEQRAALLDANRPKMAQLREQFQNLENELIHDD